MRNRDIEKPFSERFAENNSRTLQYKINEFKGVCNRLYNLINDRLIEWIG